MSKTIIPFADPSKWETKADCLFCETIDKLYRHIPTLSTYEEKQQQLSSLDDTLLVNGYDLLNVYEGMGEIMNHPNNIDRIGLYPTNRVSFMKKVHNVLYPDNRVDTSGLADIDEPILIHSRWCRKCARRKPDIFNSLSNENLSMLPITNLEVFTKTNINYVSWLDSLTEMWHYTKLVRYDNFDFDNPIEMTTYDLSVGKDKYNYNKYMTDAAGFDKRPYCFADNTIQEGQVYHYQVLNFDINNTLLCESDYQELYVPTLDFTPPTAIDNFHLVQVREVDAEALISRDFLLMNWAEPQDPDFNGVMIRMGEQEITPPTEEDGIEIKPRYSINLPNDIGRTYYVKPFPYDKLKYQPRENGKGYYSYRNYNRDSNSIYYTVKRQLDNVSDIDYQIEDEQVKVSWTDPSNENWVGTMVRYKKNGIILDKDDGILLTVTDIKDYFKKGVNSLIIPNLDNNVEYSIGLFPVSADGLVNVTLDNQFKAVTGYYKENIDINFRDEGWRSKMSYVGKFKVVDDLVKGKVLTNPIVEPEERIICFVEATDLKYGASLTLDYNCTTITDYDYCKIYFNDEELLYLTGYKRWTSLSYEIPAMDYMKLTIEWIRNYPYDNSSYVKFSNIKITYNSHI